MKKQLAFFIWVCYNNKAIFPQSRKCYARLAQLVEHLLDVQRVSGSSPLPRTSQKAGDVGITSPAFYVS